jgi:hypothetical protein
LPSGLEARHRLTTIDPIQRLLGLGSNGLNFIVECLFECRNRLSSIRPQQTEMLGPHAPDAPVLMGEQFDADQHGRRQVAGDLPDGDSGLAANRFHIVVEAMPQRWKSAARRWSEFSKGFYGSRSNRTWLVE